MLDMFYIGDIVCIVCFNYLYMCFVDVLIFLFNFIKPELTVCLCFFLRFTSGRWNNFDILLTYKVGCLVITLPARPGATWFTVKVHNIHSTSSSDRAKLTKSYPASDWLVGAASVGATSTPSLWPVTSDRDVLCLPAASHQHVHSSDPEPLTSQRSYEADNLQARLNNEPSLMYDPAN